MKPKTGISTELLRRAYCQGFFPMPDPATGELVWMNPDPRAIIPLDSFHVSKSLRRKIQKNVFQYTINQAFENVMRGCANRPDTWINSEIIELYSRLHREGDAHSVEVWQGDKLVGGVYGVGLGQAFFAESMFHTVTDASKAALFYLVENMKFKGFGLLEVQFLTPHLASLGAVEIPAENYQTLLEAATLGRPRSPFAAMPIYSTHL